MNRRTFLSSSSGLLGASLAPGYFVGPQGPIRVDGTRLNDTLRTLATFGATPEGGTTRLAYSDADRAARQYVDGLMRSAGLETHVDIAGNLIGRRAGTTDLPPIMIGSHIDSVPDGGNYDGQVGSMGALEVARTLHDRNISMRHPLHVIIFQNEEGGKTGSRAWSGELQGFELDLITRSGKTIRDGITFLGGSPARLAEIVKRPGDATAFLELHVEQGGQLEQRDTAIGVVEGIVGIKRWTIEVLGFANHAGTTPMDQRRDALLGAAEFIRAVNRIARTMSGSHVATVGSITAEPGAPNVVSGRVQLTLEIRDLRMTRIEEIYQAIQAAAEPIRTETQTTFGFEQFYESTAAPTDERLRRIIEQSADDLNLTYIRMPSGAGHDAQSVAQFAPVGMVFVPSRRGISHSPEEYTAPEDVVAGTNVLLSSVMGADRLF